jgi:hypothetical protein
LQADKKKKKKKKEADMKLLEVCAYLSLAEATCNCGLLLTEAFPCPIGWQQQQEGQETEAGLQGGVAELAMQHALSSWGIRTTK